MFLELLKGRKTYLDLRFKGSRGEVSVRVIERPGLWMNASELTQLIGDLRTIVQTMGRGDLDYGVFTGDKDRLDHAILTVLYDAKTGRPVGFNALSAIDCHLRGAPTEVIHLGLVVVDPTFRSRGSTWLLYGFTTFVLFARNRMKPLWISSVSQVPTVVGNVCDAFVNVFPTHRPQDRRTFDHLMLAREIMAEHRHVFGVGRDAEFDEERFIIKNSYTGGSDNLKKTFEQSAKHRNEAYNDLCRAELDYDRGDDFLQIGQADLSTFLTYMKHSVPKTSWISVMWEMVYVLARSLVVPAIQWFSADKPMGDLRPWKGARTP